MCAQSTKRSCATERHPRSSFTVRLIDAFTRHLLLTACSSAGPFKVTTIENPLQLVSQFVSAATLDKYHIWMGDRLVIASASSYMAILQDWQLVLDIDMNEFESSRWVR